MTNQEAKPVVEESLAKLKESVKRETTYEKEIADDKLNLETLEKMKSQGDEMPQNCPYETYDDWIAQINKEIKSGESSLSRIAREKAEIVAFEYFVQNAN